jgi:hypothetical protein
MRHQTIQPRAHPQPRWNRGRALTVGCWARGLCHACRSEVFLSERPHGLLRLVCGVRFITIA